MHPLDGYVVDSGDCDDTEINIHPDQSELCFDTIDNNCDSLIDDGSSIECLYVVPNSDIDTYGDENESMSSCSQPDGYVDDNTDCDDNNNNIHPMADEYCNEIDDDCDDVLDNDTALDALIEILIPMKTPMVMKMNRCPLVHNPMVMWMTIQIVTIQIQTYLMSAIQSCQALLDSDPTTPSGTYTIEVDGTYFDVYCDMTTDGGGWTAVAKQINDGQSCDASTPKDPLTTVSDLTDGYSLWLVPESMAQIAEEILFYDVPTDRWAIAELTDPARGISIHRFSQRK